MSIIQTGAARGLGRATVALFVAEAEGAKVVIADVSVKQGEALKA